jgi:hypothetical protein
MRPGPWLDAPAGGPLFVGEHIFADHIKKKIGTHVT